MMIEQDIEVRVELPVELMAKLLQKMSYTHKKFVLSYLSENGIDSSEVQ